jgi:aspartate/methionine/tyrosine aminotransferase
VRAFDGVPRMVPVGADEHYQLTPELASANWNAQTRIVMVASPSNPTGTLVPRAALAGLHALARARGATLVVDEIYQGLTYEGDTGTALSLGEDVFVINSFSKYFQMTGWRLGWLVAPPAYVREVEKLAQNLFISASTVAQHAALAAFAPETIAIVEERRREFAARRNYLLPALKTLGFRVPVTPEGAFYIYADSSGIARDSESLARDILERAWVAMTPGKDFGFNAPERHIRIAYTQPVARLEDAMKRIAGYLRGC